MEWHPSEPTDKALSPSPPAAQRAANAADATLRSITASDREPQPKGKSARITIPHGHTHDEPSREASQPEGEKGGSVFVPTKVTLPLNDEDSQATLQRVREEVKRIQQEQAAADEES